MTITGDKVILRDFLPEDIGKRIEWETVETEWQKWDAPWEYDGLTEAEKQQDLKRYVENMKRWAQQPPAGHERRWSFQICLNTQDRTYIGWCSAYRIDEAFHFARDGRYCAVGIDLPFHLQALPLSLLQLYRPNFDIPGYILPSLLYTILQKMRLFPLAAFHRWRPPGS